MERKKIFPHLRSQIFISINNMSLNQAIIQLFMRFFVITRINYQGWGRGYQLKPKAATNKTWKHKTKCNNCFIIHWAKKNDYPKKKMHCTWHDYPWLWVFLTWLLYNLELDEKCGDLNVNMLNSRASGPGLSPGWGNYVVFLGKTLYSHSASLHLGV